MDLAAANKNLDFLRAFAVMLVVFGHVATFFDRLGPYGHVRLVTMGTLGVLLFFVHTALVLMQSLERQPGAAAFLVRRVFRIYPLMIFVVGLIIVFRIPQASIGAHVFGGYKPDFGDIVANLSLTQNFSFRAPILGPAWSLSYEMQMYLFLPLLFGIACSVSRAFAAYFAVLIAAAGVLHFTRTPNLLVWAPCFMAGIVAYQLLKKPTPKLPAFCWPIFVALLSLIYMMGNDSPYKNYALCAALGLGIPVFEQLRSAAITRASHYVAKYSYGIYLAHFAIIYFAFDRGEHLPWGIQVVAFAAMLTVVPIALYHTIEDPMIQVGKKLVLRSRAPQPAPVPKSAESQLPQPDTNTI